MRSTGQPQKHWRWVRSCSKGIRCASPAQDSRRGTFSQRHAALIDFETGEAWIPLDDLDTDDHFWVFDSLLSEYAALGFEYGYSHANPNALVMWEAQFGDFINGAQIVIDQYIVAAEDKWGQRNGVVLLLPHGYEGQGPEHSSARIERFMTLAAEDNMQVVNTTTAANYFHLLRRQVHSERRTPLIVFSPKQGLRMKQTTVGSRRAHARARSKKCSTIRATSTRTPSRASCSARARWPGTRSTSVTVSVRRSPWCASSSCIRCRPNRCSGSSRSTPTPASSRWLQEEPENMGAWRFIEANTWRIKERGYDLRHVARVESAVPPPARRPSTTRSSPTSWSAPSTEADRFVVAMSETAVSGRFAHRWDVDGSR